MGTRGGREGDEMGSCSGELHWRVALETCTGKGIRLHDGKYAARKHKIACTKERRYKSVYRLDIVPLEAVVSHST